MAKDYLGQPLSQYVADAAAKTSAPGGGSVAALVGALATSMASMAANFTAGKEKYAAVEPQIQAALASLEKDRRRLLELMHRDMEVYAAVMDAYRLPKAAEAERTARDAAIQQALAASMEVPLEVARLAIRTLETAGELADIANANLLSDVAVAAVLAEATFVTGRINVEVNLGGLADERTVAAVRQELDDAESLAAQLKDACLKAIAARRA